MAKKYRVRLSLAERAELQSLVSTGKASAHKRLHAQILLQSDIGEGGPGWKDEQISQAVGVTIRTVENVRARLVEQGLEATINRAKPSGVKPIPVNHYKVLTL
ncbi:helix-turn-helix domain-containing protein [Deltaproteobacteria bacterium TL4]